MWFECNYKSCQKILLHSICLCSSADLWLTWLFCFMHIPFDYTLNIVSFWSYYLKVSSDICWRLHYVFFFLSSRQSCSPAFFLSISELLSKDQSRKLVWHLIRRREGKKRTNHMTKKKGKSSCVRAEKCLTTVIKLRPFLASNKTNWNRINLPTLKSSTKVLYICASFTLHFGKFHWMDGNKVFYAHEAVSFPTVDITIQSFFHKWFVNNTQKKRIKLFLEWEKKLHH